MRVRAFSMIILFLTSILSIWINGVFVEEPTSSEIAESPMQYESQGQYTWQLVFDTEPLGAEPYWSPRNPSIAIDSNDSIWVTFEDADGLYLAQGNNPQVAEQFASLTDVNGPIKSSLAIDSAGWPHVSYYESDDVDLKYATKDPTTSQWLITTVDSTGDVGDSNAIVLDSNDHPHISYIDSTNDDLKYANYDGSTWQISTLDTSLFGERFEMDSTSIAIDSNDYVHISYSNNSASYNSLKYTRDGPQGWGNISLSTPGYGSLWSDIAIDSNDDVHISYSDNFQQTLEYFTFESGAWVNATIDGWPLSNSAEIEEETSIAINSSGVPHISYWDRSTDYIMHATIDDGGSWNTTIVDGSGEAGIHSSIAIDSSDSVHISYIDDSNYSAKRAFGSFGTQTTPSLPSNAPTDWTAISVGGAFGRTCGIRDNGTLMCWGPNGLNGNGNISTWPIEPDTYPVNVSTPSGLSATQVSIGYAHSCATMSNGSAMCWGTGEPEDCCDGRLGDGLMTTSFTPVFVNLPVGRTVESISAGMSHTCAVMDNGSVMCWGWGVDGQLGDGGVNFNDFDQPTEYVGLPSGRTATSVLAGATHSCSLLDNGSVMCWGSNQFGEIGDGTTSQQSAPGDPKYVALPIGRTAISLTDVDYAGACAILDNGSAMCWGSGDDYQLGNGDINDAFSPVYVNLPAGKTATAISGSGTRCAILDDGSVVCWGDNWYGQLGNGLSISDHGVYNSTSPLEVTLPPGRTAISISVFWDHACAILDDGAAMCWGNDEWGQIGNGVTNISNTDGTYDTVEEGTIPDYVVLQNLSPPHPLGTSTYGFQVGHANQNVTLSLGVTHACAILENNTMTCWGETWEGASGMYDGTPGSGFNANWDPIWATAWPENGVASVSAGDNITCAILTNTSTYCLGNGTHGQLGNGEGDGSTSIERESIQYVDFGPGRYAVAIEAAKSKNYPITCALLDNGDVACWGVDTKPTALLINEPYVVDLDNRKAVGISVGGDWEHGSACAVLEDGEVMCWGDGIYLGFTSQMSIPTNATIWQGHDVVGISGGTTYSCALLRNGSVACGGTTLSWVGLPMGKTAISVTVAMTSSGCVILSDKSLNCWGVDQEVGNASTSNSPPNWGEVPMSNPIPANISSNLDVLAVSTTPQNDRMTTTCALLSNTEIKCWGDNQYGMIGDAYGGDNLHNQWVPTTLVIFSLNSSYWDWDSSVAPFAADDRDRDSDGVLNIFDKCLDTPVGSTVDQDGCSTSSSDDDGDGVDNSVDLCPNTPAGETVDLDGCSDSQLDDDGDGVMNDADQCPNTSPGASVDADGCALGQGDADGDGVSDLIDDCANTPAGETVDIYGCSDSQLDDDEDGVMNDADICPGTAAGASVNADGCSITQLDADGDGVSDLLDACPNTPPGEAVDIYGCSNSQLDDDGDGVMNNADQCSNTPPGEAVDNYGCSDSQLDDDSDGVMNNADQCPNTPAGESVDVNGCSGSQLDDDSDGVMNSVDQCPNTPPGETVDAVGCAPSQYDGDGDGVPDQSDQCPNTPSGVNVGADGCNYSPTCNVSYDDGAGNIVSLESELSMGTGSSSSSLSLPTGTYQFIVECTDPESDMLSMTVTLDGGSAMTFAGSPLSTGAISVPVQDGMSISKTITYYWTDGLNYGSYEIEVSLIGDDASDPDDGWLPGFEVWITLLAIIASLFFNRTRRII